VRSRRRDGFTVVELLVASAITLFALLALGGLFAQAGRTFQASAERSTSFQDVEGAVAVLRHDLALAGYPGPDRADDAEPFDAWTGGVTLRIERADASDRVTAYYLDDRYTASDDVERHRAAFERDADEGTLVRSLRTGGATYAGALLGDVGGFHVVDLVRADRSTIPVASFPTGGTVPDDVVGLRVRIERTDGRESTFVIATFNPQSVEVVDR